LSQANPEAAARAGVNISNLLLLVAAGLLFLSFGYTEMAGSDMWWHIAAGRELLQTQTLWMVDDWSFSAHGQAWHNHEWLADIIYYIWVSAWGVESLVYWKWLVVIATFMTLLAVLARETGNPLVALVCAGFAIANAAPFIDVRPHLYSLLCFCLLLWLALGRRPKTWSLGLLFVIWVNLHGGFFFGLMALAILLFPWRNLTMGTVRGAAGIALVCVLACVLNPSGVKAFGYPLAYAFDNSSPYRQLAEWLSPFKAGGITSQLFFQLMWLPLLGIAYALPGIRKHTGIPWEGIALTLLTLAMAVTSRRFVPLYGICLALMIAPLLSLALNALRVGKISLLLAILALVYAGWRMLPYPLSRFPAFHYLTAEYLYPVDLLDYAEANNISGNVYALYNWGGYIHWRTDGRLKVFIDGRADTIYSDETYLEYTQVLDSAPGWIEKLEQSGADYVMWPYLRGHGQQKLKELLDTGRWRPLYSDSVGWLLASTSVPEIAEPVQPGPGPWQDMGLAQLSAWSGKVEQAITQAQRVRQSIPWHKDACNLLAESYRRQGKQSQAATVIADCRSYFPSAYLR